MSLFLWKRQAYNFACIMGGGDSHGADNVVDVGIETIDETLCLCIWVTTVSEA